MDLDKMPEQVRNFVLAAKENAREAFSDDASDIADDVIYVSQKENGDVVICDNYERFFDVIYTYGTDGNWRVRRMFSDMPERPYSYDAVMADASIMFTG